MEIFPLFNIATALYSIELVKSLGRPGVENATAAVFLLCSDHLKFPELDWLTRERHLRCLLYLRGFNLCIYVVKSTRTGLREQEVLRTGMPRAERRPVVQAKRSGEQLLASNEAAAV